MVWEPKQCCCGASIRVGTLVLGWLALIGNALHVLSLLKFASLSHQDYLQICTNVSKSDPEINFDPEVCADVVVSSLAVMGVLSGVGVIISILLLIGVDKNKHLLMLPFLISQGLGLVSIGLLGVMSFIFLCYYGLVLGAFLFVVIYGLLMFLEVYFFLIIRVCYLEVKQYNLGMSGDSNIAYVEQRDAIYNYKI